MDNFGTFSLVEERVLFDESEPKTETKAEKLGEPEAGADFIVLAVDNPAFKISKPSFEIDIYGKTMLEWVKSVCENEPKVRQVEPKHNVLEEIKPLLGEKDITVVLYSDAPLITKNTVNQAISFLLSRGLNVCKLTHGYIFKTEYVKRAFDIFLTETHYFNEEDFLIASNFKQLSLISEIARNRILSYHMTNGVHIIDPSSTHIGCDVKIGKDVTIHPNNIVYGRMEIGDDVTLFSENLIGDGVIMAGSTVLMSRIKKSVIEKNVKIVYSSVDKSFIGEGVDLRLDSKVTSSVIGSGTCILGGTIFNAKVGRNCILNTGCMVISYKDEKVILKDNVIIGAGAVLPIALVVGENSTVLPTTLVRIDVPPNSIFGNKTESEIKPKQ